MLALLISGSFNSALAVARSLAPSVGWSTDSDRLTGPADVCPIAWPGRAESGRATFKRRLRTHRVYLSHDDIDAQRQLPAVDVPQRSATSVGRTEIRRGGLWERRAVAVAARGHLMDTLICHRLESPRKTRVFDPALFREAPLDSFSLISHELLFIIIQRISLKLDTVEHRASARYTHTHS